MQKAFCFTSCLLFIIVFLNGALCDGLDQPSEDELEFVNFTYYSPPPPPIMSPPYVYESPPPPWISPSPPVSPPWIPPPSPSPPVSPPFIYNSPPPPQPTPSPPPVVYPPPSSPPPPCPPPPSPTYPPLLPPPTPPSSPPIIYASPPPPFTAPPSPVVYTPPPSSPMPPSPIVYTPPPSLVPPSPPLYTYASPPPPLPTPPPPSPTCEYSPPYSPPPSYLYASPPPPYYCPYQPPSSCPWETDDDVDTCLLNNILKIEYMLAEFYLYSTFSHRLQGSAARSGKANLEDNSLLIHMVSDFSLLSITHISETLQLLKERALERPEIDISKAVFSKIMNKAFGHHMVPQFDAYANVTNFLITAYTIGPSFGVSLCIDALPRLQDPNALKLVAELLSSFSIQDATITTMVFEKKDEVVAPYNYTVLDFVENIANFKKQLDTHGTHGKSHEAKNANHHTHALKKGKFENTKDMNHHVHASNDKNYHFLKRMVMSDIVSLGDTRIWNNALKIVTSLGLIQHGD